MKQSVIIVAGGKGLRMGSDLPKQFLPIGGKPVLMRTLEAFRKYDAMLQIILVLPREQQDFWKQLCEEHHFSVEHLVADGGETRFHSVKNGLALVEAPGLVGVHDGVRPFVSLEVIRRCYKLAEQHKAVIPVVDVVETLRHLTDAGSETVSRTEYKLVQTPQVFDVELLKQAYGQEFTLYLLDHRSHHLLNRMRIEKTPFHFLRRIIIRLQSDGRKFQIIRLIDVGMCHIDTPVKHGRLTEDDVFFVKFILT